MAVAVEISVHNLELTDRLRDYVTKKVAKLDRYLVVLEEAKVDLSYAKSARSASDRHVAQLTVLGRGVMLRAEERSDDIFAAVDAVLEKINRQIERYKGRRWRGRGDGRSAAQVSGGSRSVTAGNPPAEAGVIARRKRFQLIPMDEQEAIEQMGLLGHEDFFVFLNAGTNQVNVLYQRRDGTFGLIEPEVG
ncbi:MAG: ribosome-associated translation inhibitor RaiA [Chloroflexota bacterium]